MQRILSIIFSIFVIGNSFAQLQIFPIRTDAKCCVSTNATQKNARTKALSAMPIPFWDDFSYASQTEVYPNDTLWQSGQSIWVNNGTGINPPSLGVATFDGIDSSGKPYSINDVLAKGIGDSLVSRPLRMDLVESANRGTVFLSFYFQFRGNGEPPDAGDQLIISSKNNKGKWDIIKIIENEGSFAKDIFYPLLLPISGDQYFHDAFQFRFQSFGRLSGPYDTWNVDYVYLNEGRSQDEILSFPDRSITAPLTYLFKGYWSVPYEHFLKDPEANYTQPSLTIYNLSIGNDQPLNYNSYDSIISYKGGIKSSNYHRLDSAKEIGGSLPGLQRRSITMSKIPLVSNLDKTADSVRIKLKIELQTLDNVLISKNGDYDPVKYSPIDFRSNDTTRAEYTLSDYYAYDDGTAEYGASLVQPGSQLAYLFELRSTKLDTIARVDLYFPKFGDETSQVMQLQILSDLTKSPASLLYTENITIQRSVQNKVWQHILSRPVGVNTKFYIVLKQTSSSIIAIGLDKNTDSGQKMFFNSNGTWVQNVNVKGSLMIRPAFGKGEKGDTVTSVANEPKEVTQSAYPNPNDGTFFVPLSSERIYVFDITGRLIDHDEFIEGDQKRIQIPSPTTGIYVLKIYTREKIYTQKIMVQP